MEIKTISRMLYLSLLLENKEERQLQTPKKTTPLKAVDAKEGEKKTEADKKPLGDTKAPKPAD